MPVGYIFYTMQRYVFIFLLVSPAWIRLILRENICVSLLFSAESGLVVSFWNTKILFHCSFNGVHREWSFCLLSVFSKSSISLPSCGPLRILPLNSGIKCFTCAEIRGGIIDSNAIHLTVYERQGIFSAAPCYAKWIITRGAMKPYQSRISVHWLEKWFSLLWMIDLTIINGLGLFCTMIILCYFTSLF